MRQEDATNQSQCQSVADSARADYECHGCGIGYFGSPPARCEKCGGFSFNRIRPQFAEIEASINRIRDFAREAYGRVEQRRHRKARFICGQFQRVIEAMDLAQNALLVASGKRKG